MLCFHVKFVQTDRQTDGQTDGQDRWTDRRTKVKQYAPNLSIGGHNKAGIKFISRLSGDIDQTTLSDPFDCQ